MKATTHMISPIMGLERSELREKIASVGEKQFRADQVWNWFYARGAKSFSEMTNLSKQSHNMIGEVISLDRPEIVSDRISFDGTQKWLTKFSDDNKVETVFIPEETRGTLCISSQIGCTLACKFCHTGTQTLVRNLEAHEIVSQVVVAKDLISDWMQTTKKLTNIVFMGMGEPFFNYENVAKAVKILTNPDGLAFSNRRITISTSGLVPQIMRAATELGTNLAISLHATSDAKRTDIMAINKRYPLSELMKACAFYNKSNPGSKITFEYVMLDSVNDQKEDAFNMIELIKKYNLNAKVNLIPFNTWDGCEYLESKNSTITNFATILKSSGIITTVRKTRGSDVMAACGQLKSDSIRTSIKNRIGNEK